MLTRQRCLNKRLLFVQKKKKLSTVVFALFFHDLLKKKQDCIWFCLLFCFKYTHEWQTNTYSKNCSRSLYKKKRESYSTRVQVICGKEKKKFNLLPSFIFHFGVLRSPPKKKKKLKKVAAKDNLTQGKKPEDICWQKTKKNKNVNKRQNVEFLIQKLVSLYLFQNKTIWCLKNSLILKIY